MDPNPKVLNFNISQDFTVLLIDGIGRQRCNTVSKASDQADVDYVECNPDYVEKVGSHALPSHCSVPIPEDSEVRHNFI